MIEKTQYYNLDKPTKGTTNWHENLNDNFDIIDGKLYEQYSRVNTIITTSISGEGTGEELVDARKGYNVLGERLNGIDSLIETNKISTDNSIVEIQATTVRKDVADTKSGDLTMINDSGIIFGNIKFVFNAGLGTVDIVTV